MKNKLQKLYNFSNSWTGTVIIVLLVIFFIAQAFVIPSGSMKNTLLIGDHLFVKKFSYGVPIPHIPWIEVPVLPDFKGDGHLIDANGPQRGDIVVFRYPNNIKIHYVKRCVALGGDEILYSNETLYIRFREGDEYMKKNFQPGQLVVLADKLWVKNPYKYKYPGIHYDKNIDIFEQMNLYMQANQLAMQPAIVKEFPNKQGLMFNSFYKKVPKDEYFMMGDNRDHSNDSRFWGSVPYSLIVGKPWFIYFSWDKNYNIRWNRIGRFIDNLQTDKSFLNGK